MIGERFVAVKNSLVRASLTETLLVKIKNFLPNLPLPNGYQRKIYSKKIFTRKYMGQMLNPAP
jgi:hypothetical protein